VVVGVIARGTPILESGQPAHATRADTESKSPLDLLSVSHSPRLTYNLAGEASGSIICQKRKKMNNHNGNRATASRH
jgi:hypothetical protein